MFFVIKSNSYKSSGDEVMGVSTGKMIDIGNYNYHDSLRRYSRLRLRHSNWYEGIPSNIGFDTNEYSLNNTVNLNENYVILKIEHYVEKISEGQLNNDQIEKYSVILLFLSYLTNAVLSNNDLYFFFFNRLSKVLHKNSACGNSSDGTFIMLELPDNKPKMYE